MQGFGNANALQSLYGQVQPQQQQPPPPQQWMQQRPVQSFQQQQAYMQNQQQWMNQPRSVSPPPRFPNQQQQQQQQQQNPWQYQQQMPMSPPNYMLQQHQQQQQQQRRSVSPQPYFQQQFQQPRSATPPPYMQQEYQQSPYGFNQWPEQPMRPQTAPVQYYQSPQQTAAGPSTRPITPPGPAATKVSKAIVPQPSAIASTSATPQQVHSTLTEPVSVTLRRDVNRVANNLKQIVVITSTGGDPAQTLRDWDLWGPFFFIIAMSCILSSTATDNKSTVFAVVFAVLSAGAVSLTMNVVLLGGKLNFLQSLSVLGYCLFPLDVGAILCLASSSKIYKTFVVLVTLIWCSWSVYPFVSTAVRPSRKALAVYPVFLMYISMGFLVLAND